MLTVKYTVYGGPIAEAQEWLHKAKQRAKPHEATIGIHEEEGGVLKHNYYGRDGVDTLAQIMMEHEFGAGVPERSFLRGWFDTHLEQIAHGMIQALQSEILGDALAVERWVRSTHAEWKQWIASGPFARLAPQTVTAKQKAGLPEPDVPLMATYQFREAWKAKLDGVTL